MEQSTNAEEFDEQALAELRADLEDSFDGFVEQFIATARTALDDIDECLQRGDYARVQVQAHTLRGTTGYLGAISMGKALEALEQAAKREGGAADAVHHAAQARDAFIKAERRLLNPA